MLSLRRAVFSVSPKGLTRNGSPSTLLSKTHSNSLRCRGGPILIPNARFATVKDTPWQLSSLSEPSPSLFQNVPEENEVLLSLSPSTYSENLDAWLRSDVRNMGAILGKSIQQHEGQGIFEKVEKLRHCAKQWRAASAGRDKDTEADANAAFDSMTTFVSSFTDDELYVVSRAFSHFLAIANAAEMHHRSRRVRADLIRGSSRDDETGDQKIRALRDAHDSCGRIFSDLLEKGVDKAAIHKTICSQKVEIVLTAHPTEVNRRTLLEKKKRVLKLLEQADLYRAMGASTPYQRKLVDDAMEREITNIWQTDEVSRFKPNPQTEAQLATLAIETVLWEAVPSFLRKLDATLKSDLGEEYGLPLDAAPIKFASWMGGDRDGNPNVTPQVTREVCLTNRLKATSLFISDLQKMYHRSSINICSAELRSKIDDTDAARRQPYRVYLAGVIDKLVRTEEWLTDSLTTVSAFESSERSNFTPQTKKNVYVSNKEFMDDIMLIHRSLEDTNNGVLADGLVTDVLRNISTFGLALCPLDVRQESDRHTEAMDCITRFLGLGSYSQWDESTRIIWLSQQLTSNRPLMRAGEWRLHPNFFPPTAVETLETFEMIAEQLEGSLGAYVISQATDASDVLAVLALQRDAGVKKPLRVVPLFETLDDLNGAAKTIDKLFSVQTYRGSINGKQEIMIGYSDSAKDAGRLAASWAQFKTQEQLVSVAQKHGIDLTFFHGKGGTVGRGGNPETFKAIMAHAPNTIRGQFRVTEQGEMIFKNFGVLSRAERTLDIFTAAVCAEQHIARASPTTEYRNLMEVLSEKSCEAYRSIVRGDPRFVPYFRSATPELELGSLMIGSRPAKRKASGGVESLRAIPWIFAWTQTRLNLPTWLGVGEALNDVLSQKKTADKIKLMYNDWGSFKTTIDLVEMVLAKSEPVIAKHYDDTLVHDEKAQELGAAIRSIHLMTEKSVLELTNHKKLGENNELLTKALAVRNPYVDALNILQVETLKRVRATDNTGDEKKKKLLMDALLTTITGISNGMGNTG
eukprot:CAMPEP_0172416338 /NCGR_PEP_ID=MMETSP1064-20121228/2826_1 /TAXON_ID=202472 /ORGANISM="Aulacoseira subarctica , Strain CCAP 1002/5" /LENGTH=1028 /DNA_ID=CAMNT_0013153925 /DNA_START=32 /DNA_END=3118 /DNA_ORIENTATION=+